MAKPFQSDQVGHPGSNGFHPRSIYRSFRQRPSSSAAVSFATTAVSEDIEIHPKWPPGVRPWVSLVGCFFLMFNSWGLVNAYGTFSSMYMQLLMPGQDLLRLGTIGGTQCFIVLALSGIAGRLLDAGMYRYLISIGTVLVTVGMFALAWSAGDGGWNQGRYPLIWVSQGLTMGLGMACFFVASSQIISSWFPRRKATVIGIVASGASIAGIVYPVATKFLVSKLGWKNAVMSISGIVLFTSCIALACAHPNPTVPFRPPTTWRRIETWIDPHAFRNRGFCWLVASIAWMFFGFYAVFFNLEEWAMVTGVGYRDSQAVGIAGEPLMRPDKHSAVRLPGSMQTFFLLSIMNGSSTIGRIVAAYLSDKIDTPTVHMTVILLCSLLVLTVWTTAKGLAQTLAFVILFGCFSGAVIGLPPASMAWVLGKSTGSHSKLGQWTGMMYTCAAIPALVGPVVAGHLITVYDTFLTVQIWSGICLLLSGICMGIARWYGIRDADSFSSPDDSTVIGSWDRSELNSRVPTICAPDSSTPKRDDDFVLALTSLTQSEMRARLAEECHSENEKSQGQHQQVQQEQNRGEQGETVIPASENHHHRRTTLSFLSFPTPSRDKRSPT